jgi:hypothetical protein
VKSKQQVPVQAHNLDPSLLNAATNIRQDLVEQVPSKVTRRGAKRGRVANLNPNTNAPPLPKVDVVKPIAAAIPGARKKTTGGRGRGIRSAKKPELPHAEVLPPAVQVEADPEVEAEADLDLIVRDEVAPQNQKMDEKSGDKLLGGEEEGSITPVPERVCMHLS